MKIKTSILLIVFVFAISAISTAQEKDSISKNPYKAHYMAIGTGGTFSHIKDDIMSPLNYYGFGFGLFPSLIFEREKSINRFNISASYSAMTNLIAEHNGRALNLQTDLDYFHLRKLKKPFLETFDWYVGGGLNTSSNFRWHNQLNNSSFVYANFFSISASSFVTKTFNFWGTDWIINYQLTMPLISTDIRPNYIGVINFIEPEPDYVGEIMDLMTVSTLNKFFKLNSRFDFGFKLKNGNQVLFNYMWDYYTFRKNSRIDAAYHLFGVSILTNL